MFPWQTWAEAHAALNDLPPVLFVASVLFDLLGSASRRASLKAAGFWTLLLGVLGAVGAVISGEMAEGTIEHGEAIHEAMGRHETMAITVSVVFGLLALWRLWRRGALGPREWRVYLVVAAMGAGLVTYVAHLGGNIVFRLGGGIPTSVMEEAIHERAEGHHHGDGAGEQAEDGQDTAARALDGGASKARKDSALSGRDSTGALPHRRQ